ncbi:hypothetical protein SAMD00019534_050710 [Acytostelium subglobosum LB1]|uniref:hypothetical protein n=1 Tax=Acytostelium subglobosum LB1 TaxID=1410327 RepID=UPI000644CC65|nr:hypothetical protein SAMD00019534_050710 [Acytostelium subglobosum LB1]GAM21896.1 hypothetical protein SAMD00019534_050710 [Acytostelium subglobosum LB1]|eukprot:XP_012754996.1 hypothetical protein SAMD00019534_050710 [Acytostelium subglobosum LB1]
MSSYDNVIGGKLRLKGSVPTTPNHQLKKKKKKKTKTIIRDHRDNDDNHSPDQQQQQYEDSGTKLTPAEVKHKELTARLEAKRIEAMIKHSHKEKVEEYNKKLGRLSEHHDVPKVGPG